MNIVDIIGLVFLDVFIGDKVVNILEKVGVFCSFKIFQNKVLMYFYLVCSGGKRIIIFFYFIFTGMYFLLMELIVLVF